jgi:hypothetical protein
MLKRACVHRLLCCCLLLLLQVLLLSVEVAMEYLMGLTTSPYVELLQVRLL